MFGISFLTPNTICLVAHLNCLFHFVLAFWIFVECFVDPHWLCCVNSVLVLEDLHNEVYTAVNADVTHVRNNFASFQTPQIKTHLCDSRHVYCNDESVLVVDRLVKGRRRHPWMMIGKSRPPIIVIKNMIQLSCCSDEVILHPASTLVATWRQNSAIPNSFVAIVIGEVVQVISIVDRERNVSDSGQIDCS